MADYIRRDIVLKIINTVNDTGGFAGYADYCVLFDEIDTMPAADVQPIRHGRWIDCTFYDPYEKSWEQNYEFKCSNCGHKIYNKPNDDNLFCGHCNARMNSDTKDLQPVDRWISVDEALPIYDGLVLAVDKNNTIRLGIYTDLGWTSQFGNPMVAHITHWMPLPQPPKEE